MNTNSKTSLYNSSSYGQRQADKQAIFNNTKYGQMQAKLKAKESDTTSKKYTLPDGRVLVRPASGSKIDFKSLFAGIGEDEADATVLINKMKATSSNIMDAYAAQSKQRLGLS